jgi:hypothetical protein
LGGNGNDHAVWAEPLLVYRGGKVLKWKNVWCLFYPLY